MVKGQDEGPLKPYILKGRVFLYLDLNLKRVQERFQNGQPGGLDGRLRAGIRGRAGLALLFLPQNFQAGLLFIRGKSMVIGKKELPVSSVFPKFNANKGINR